MPEEAKLITNLGNCQLRTLAENYLKSRKLPVDNLYVCSNGRYANRIIIPYYDNNKKLIYYNGRSINYNKLRISFENSF